MKIALIGLVLLVVLGAVAALVLQRKRQDPDAGPPPNYRRRDFLSKAERSFFRVLQQAVGRGGLVFAKVRLADLLTPAGGVGQQGYQAAFNRISAKHVDFVICGPEDVVPRVVIELDDASQRQAHRQERDAFIDAACHSADLPLLRISAQRDYGMQQLRTELAEYLDRELPDPRAPVARSLRTQELPAIPKLSRPAPAAPSNPLCPKCGAAMEKRTGKSGPLAGKEFWGCSSFPRCHGMLPVAMSG